MRFGLGMNTERTTLKCYLADTGLFHSLAFDANGNMPAEIYERILHGKLEVNLGFVMENVVSQMLTMLVPKIRQLNNNFYLYVA